MVDRDQDGNVKKSLLEKMEGLLDKVPGLSEFRGREKMRDQDKILRVHSAQEIDKIKAGLDSVKTDLLSQGKLGFLDDLEGLTKKLDRARDTHRFDAYGFAGLFDANKVMEEELGLLYEYDLKILKEIEKTQNVIKGLATGLTEEDVKGALPVLRGAVNSLLDLVLDRKNQLTKIGG